MFARSPRRTVLMSAILGLGVIASSCQILHPLIPQFEEAVIEVEASGEIDGAAYDVRSSGGDDGLRGVKEMKRDNWRSALTYLEKAIQAEPEDANLHFLAGLCREQLGDNTAAMNSHKKADDLTINMEDYAESYLRARRKARGGGDGGHGPKAHEPDGQPQR